jgi:hypothetical protein
MGTAACKWCVLCDGSTRVLVSLPPSNCNICIREIKLVVESITQLVDDRVWSSSWNGRIKLWGLALTTEIRHDARLLEIAFIIFFLTE